MAEKLEFSEEVRREFDEILTRYPEKQAALLPVLHVVQRELGHISAEAEEYVARLLELPPVKRSMARGQMGSRYVDRLIEWKGKRPASA